MNLNQDAMIMNWLLEGFLGSVTWVLTQLNFKCFTVLTRANTPLTVLVTASIDLTSQAQTLVAVDCIFTLLQHHHGASAGAGF